MSKQESHLFAVAANEKIEIFELKEGSEVRNIAESTGIDSIEIYIFNKGSHTFVFGDFYKFKGIVSNCVAKMDAEGNLDLEFAEKISKHRIGSISVKNCRYSEVQLYENKFYALVYGVLHEISEDGTVKNLAKENTHWDSFVIDEKTGKVHILGNHHKRLFIDSFHLKSPQKIARIVPEVHELTLDSPKIGITPNGQFILVGSLACTDTDKESKCSVGWGVVKLTPAGSIDADFQKNFGAGLPTTASDVEFLPDGSTLVVGEKFLFARVSSEGIVEYVNKSPPRP